jgi:hypothetical protein
MDRVVHKLGNQILDPLTYVTLLNLGPLNNTFGNPFPFFALPI